MIQAIQQVMLYVNDVNEVAKFWIELVGFVKISEQHQQGIYSIEIACTTLSETHFVLFDKAVISKMEPELNFGTPSIMFKTDDIDALYETFKVKGITVGNLIDYPDMRAFNFCDPENNYFAVCQEL